MFPWRAMSWMIWLIRCCIDFSAAVDGRTLIITSALDNLVKGASGQAIQNLNLMFGLPEEQGLLARGI